MPKITSAAKLQAIAEENELFLRHLRNTGNVTMAASMAKRDRTTFKSRRRVDRTFDEQWRAAISFAQASLNRKGATAARGNGAMRAAGGEYSIGPNRAGNLQVRRARPGHVTAEGERAFLDHLAVTANIQLAAEAVGVDPEAIGHRGASREARCGRGGGEVREDGGPAPGLDDGSGHGVCSDSVEWRQSIVCNRFPVGGHMMFGSKVLWSGSGWRWSSCWVVTTVQLRLRARPGTDPDTAVVQVLLPGCGLVPQGVVKAGSCPATTPDAGSPAVPSAGAAGSGRVSPERDQAATVAAPVRHGAFVALRRAQ